ncbi:MAG: hypothetical protein CENE_01429 [Candidatus Celerinatantimonas neptuna]|nr:MAG: hypothetical protein CENE_01429 [Candidatus Celerinatantimonas neptuna]
MSERFIRYTQKKVYRLIGYQACAICLMTFGAFIFTGSQIVFSVFVGSVVFFIANWVYLLFSLYHYGVNDINSAVKNAYAGQAVKLAMVVGLGALCMHFFKINGLAFLSGFILSVLVHCFTLLFIFQSR